MGSGSGQRQRHVAAFVQTVVAQCLGGEHQLAGEPEQVEGARPILIAEGAQCQMVLAQQQLFLVLGTELRVVLLAHGFAIPVGHLHGLVRPCPEGIVMVRFEVLENGSRQLHDMGIRVMDGAVLYVRHGSLPSELWRPGTLPSGQVRREYIRPADRSPSCSARLLLSKLYPSMRISSAYTSATIAADSSS